MSAEPGGEDRPHCVECDRYVQPLGVAKYLNDDTVEDQVEVICNDCYGAVYAREMAARHVGPPAGEVDVELADGLRAWAKGWLPQMAAVEFVLGVYPELNRRNSMIGRHTEEEGGGWYLNLYGHDEDSWNKLTGYMSGGERATWMLARSLALGELAAEFSRLDARRRLAFSEALEVWNLS